MVICVSTKTQTQMPALLSVQELAEYLGVPIATVYRWRARGGGPRGLKVGRHGKYRVTDVTSWLDSNADGA